MEATGSGTNLQEVVWRETVKRGIQYKFDEDTMPHALIRLADDTFYFGPLNGGTYGGTVIEDWRERGANEHTSRSHGSGQREAPTAAHGRRETATGVRRQAHARTADSPAPQCGRPTSVMQIDDVWHLSHPTVR